MKKLFSIFSAALFAIVLICQNPITVDAADPTTYYVQYDKEAEQWYYQVGSSWDDTVPPPKREIYYMLQDMKDGDYVVVEAIGDWPELELDFHLGNLTIMPYSSCMVKAKSVAECYVLHDAYVSITSDVEHGWVYGNATANFNLNCNTLELIYDNEPEMSVAVLGTCNELWVHNDTSTWNHLWSFTDDLIYNNGRVHTAHESFSINPPATPAAPVVPTTTTSTPASSTTSTPASSTTSADEYDDVPKTGESTAYLWTFAIAALCFVGSYSLKKRS